MLCYHSLVSLPCRLPALVDISPDRMRLILKPGLMVSEGHALSSEATLTMSLYRAVQTCQARGVVTSAVSGHPVVVPGSRLR